MNEQKSELYESIKESIMGDGEMPDNSTAIMLDRALDKCIELQDRLDNEQKKG